MQGVGWGGKKKKKSKSGQLEWELQAHRLKTLASAEGVKNPRSKFYASPVQYD